MPDVLIRLSDVFKVLRKWVHDVGVMLVDDRELRSSLYKLPPVDPDPRRPPSERPGRDGEYFGMVRMSLDEDCNLARPSVLFWDGGWLDDEGNIVPVEYLLWWEPIRTEPLGGV